MKPVLLGFGLCLGAIACGQSESQLHVTNSTSATGQFPGIVMLEMITPNGRGLCTGTFITSKVVLTAAHCVSEVNEILVEGVRAIKFTPHPKWNTGDMATYGYDIAVVEFDRASSDETFSIADAIPQPGEEASIVGFGFTDWNTRFDAGTKRQGQTEIYTFDATGGSYMIHSIGCNGAVCSDEANQSAVGQGDSGGPLLVNGQVVGVASLGASDGTRADSLHAALHQQENVEFLNSEIKDLNLNIAVVNGAAAVNPSQQPEQSDQSKRALRPQQESPQQQGQQDSPKVGSGSGKQGCG